MDKVLLMSDAEILHSASSAHTAGGGAGGATAPFGPDSPAAVPPGAVNSIAGPGGGAVAARAAVSQQEALVSMLGDLMKNVGPDNYVFQAAKQAMQSAQRRLPGGGDAWDGDVATRQSGRLDEKCVHSLSESCSAHILSTLKGRAVHYILSLIHI